MNSKGYDKEMKKKEIVHDNRAMTCDLESICKNPLDKDCHCSHNPSPAEMKAIEKSRALKQKVANDQVVKVQDQAAAHFSKMLKVEEKRQDMMDNVWNLKNKIEKAEQDAIQKENQGSLEKYRDQELKEKINEKIAHTPPKQDKPPQHPKGKEIPPPPKPVPPCTNMVEKKEIEFQAALRQYEKIVDDKYVAWQQFKIFKRREKIIDAQIHQLNQEIQDDVDHIHTAEIHEIKEPKNEELAKSVVQMKAHQDKRRAEVSKMTSDKIKLSNQVQGLRAKVRQITVETARAKKLADRRLAELRQKSRKVCRSC